MKNESYCQSCSLPLENDALLGTNKDGSKNLMYCINCYQNGCFTENITMETMIQRSINRMNELFKNNPDFNENYSRQKMLEFFPQLERWKQS